MPRPLCLVGAPTSMGAHAPGQEKAPRALRDAGIAERLTEAGLEVIDGGDGPIRRWRPDKENRFAQNLSAVVEAARETAQRVRRFADGGGVTLVLGGDCTVELGTVAGHLTPGERVGLLYFDLHTDLNVPGSIREGALDWMGVAHLLGEDGASEALSRLGPHSPLLDGDDVFFFSHGPEQMTGWEREVFERRGLKGVTADEVAADPEGAAAAALAEMEPRSDRLLVHFDVDTVDFTDLPLSEDTGRNRGLAFGSAMRALRVLLGSRRLGALTVTELNPDHGDEDGSTVGLFAEALAATLAASPALRAPG
jgi:arginase